MQSVFTAALEAGGTTFFFQPPHEALASQWQKLAKFRAVQLDEPGTQENPGEVSNAGSCRQQLQRFGADTFSVCLFCFE